MTRQMAALAGNNAIMQFCGQQGTNNHLFVFDDDDDWAVISYQLHVFLFVC